MGLTICLIMIYRISATERKIRRMRRMHRMAGCSPSEASTAEATSPSPADAAEASDEERTRSLLGDELYDDMVWRVEEVLARHASDSSQTMLLDTGPESHEGHTVLHSLLPGDMLELEMLEDQAAVGVRAEGELIGLVHGGGARKVTRLMQLGLVTGAYVAEQNCYGMSDDVALKVIVFFRPECAEDALWRTLAEEKICKFTFSGGTPATSFTIYQN